MRTSFGRRAVIFLLGTTALLLVSSIPGVLADIINPQPPPGVIELMILLLLTIVGLWAIFVLLRRAGYKLMGRRVK